MSIDGEATTTIKIKLKVGFLKKVFIIKPFFKICYISIDRIKF
jgi:hypothetical protein